MLDKEQVTKEFHELDLAGDGRLKFMALRSALELKDCVVSDEALRRWLRESDRQGKGYVDINDYLALYGYGKDTSKASLPSGKNLHRLESTGLSSMGIQRSDALLKRAFAKYDVDEDGFISVQDLRDAFQSQGMDYNDKDLINWVKKRDVSEVGAVSFEDFVNFFSR